MTTLRLRQLYQEPPLQQPPELQLLALLPLQPVVVMEEVVVEVEEATRLAKSISHMVQPAFPAWLSASCVFTIS